MDQTVRLLLLSVFTVVVFTFYLLLRLNPGVVDTRIEDGIGHSIEQGECQCVVGIDLGTAYASAAVYVNDTVMIIPNEHGSLRTPSYVAFSRYGEPIVGDEAKNYLTTDPQSVVFHAMRFLGRKHSDSFIRREEKYYPFSLISGDDDELKFEINVKDKRKRFAPEEILALILKKLKDLAETYLKTEVDCAVISVPAVFLQAQRHAVRDAAMIAGLKVIRLPNTPSISAAGYINTRRSAIPSWGETNILVYYLGAGSCEVSLMTVSSTVVQVAATNGTRDIGSASFVHRVMQHFIMQNRTRRNIIREDDMVAQRLRREVERAMLEFYIGGQTNTTIVVTSKDGKVILEEVLTRTLFDDLFQETIYSTVKHIRRVLAEAKELSMKVKDIVLLGGGTRVASVKDVIQSVFTEMNVVCGESGPGEAKVRGVALRSALIQRKISSPILLDISSYAIGIFLKDQNKTVIPQFSPLPYKKAAQYVTVADNQERIDTKFYEGDFPRPGKNLLMYNLVVEGLRKQQAGEGKIEIQYELNVDGLLQVYGKEIGNKHALPIFKPMNILPDDEVQVIIARWRKLARKGAKYIDRVLSESLLSKCVYSVLHVLSRLSAVNEPYLEYIAMLLKAEIKWLERSGPLDPVNFHDRRISLKKALARMPRNITDLVSIHC